MSKKDDVPILPDKSKLPREAKKIHDTLFDRIYKYYFKTNVRIELTKKEKEIKKRWETAWQLSGNILTTASIVHYQKEAFGITERTAYDDLFNARKLFGSSSDQMKKAKREILSEWLIQAMNKAYNQEEWKSFEKLSLRYARINGLDVTNSNDQLTEMISKMKPHTIIITGDPQALKQEADQLMEDVDTEDTDYESVDDED